jgi:SAM-dependent methyltransferase
MKIYNAMSNWGKILLFCLLFLILVVLLNTVSMRRKLKEGYEQRDNEEKGEKFILKEGNDIYDDFYISIYDDLFYSSMKDDYEIGQIINKTEPTSESRILDIGSGIGHHVSKLEEQGYHAIGLDASEAMVKKAKETFPSSEFIVGDATGALNFQFNYFTHILCMYFTIYHIKNKERFFTNVINWLMPGGYFILHLVDRDNFDPILPAGQGFSL